MLAAIGFSVDKILLYFNTEFCQPKFAPCFWGEEKHGILPGITEVVKLSWIEEKSSRKLCKRIHSEGKAYGYNLYFGNTNKSQDP